MTEKKVATLLVTLCFEVPQTESEVRVDGGHKKPIRKENRNG
jgi:hypothetical protein